MKTVDREAMLENIRAEKLVMLDIAEQQIVLRRAVCEKMERDNISRDEITKHLKIPKQKILSFLDGKTVMTGAVLLNALEEFLDDPQLMQGVRRTVETMQKSSKVALALYTTDTIHLVYEIYDAYYAGPDTRREIFAAAFGNQQELIMDVLSRKREAYDALQNPGNAQAVLELLTSGELATEIQAKHDEMSDEYRGLCAELKPLMDELIAYYKTAAAAYDALGIHRTSHSTMIQDPPPLKQFSPRDVLNLIDRCKKELAKIRESDVAEPNKKAALPQVPEAREKKERVAHKTKKQTTPKPPAPANAKIQLSPQMEGLLYYQLDGVISSLRATLKTLEGFIESDFVPIRESDQLELARAVVKMLRLGAIDNQALSEVAFGQPIENPEQLLQILGVIQHGTEGSDK